LKLPENINSGNFNTFKIWDPPRLCTVINVFLIPSSDYGVFCETALAEGQFPPNINNSRYLVWVTYRALCLPPMAWLTGRKQ